MNIDDVYGIFLKRFRRRRMAEFSRLFQPSAATRVIDVGGYEFNWTLIAEAPQVVLVNLEPENWSKERFRKVQGDGRALQFADNSFDIAYSNSVIEHVGGPADQQAFAREVRRVAPSYFVQTPSAKFFVEPHLIAPFIHWLPFAWTRRLARWCSVWGWMTRPTQAQVDEFLRSIRLLDRHDMEQLFPDAEIMEERFMGMVKSLIAVRR